MGILDYLFQKISKLVLKHAYIPDSIAVIMDGNRRFAKTKKIEKVKGHEEGLGTLLNFCEWSIAFGVKEVIAYAFSIDNFNRSKEEVDGIKGLIREKFKKMYSEKGVFHKLGIRVIIIGKIDYFENDIVQIFDEVEKETASNNK